MSLNSIIKRELEVAFSKHAQPVWVRIVKYLVIAAILYFLWGTSWLWIVLISVAILSIAIHLWYRYKTNAWTKSYRGWDYEKNKPGKKAL